jgi:hypothetical protein
MEDRKGFAIQTDPPKPEVVEKPPEYEYGAQTDFIVERPVSLVLTFSLPLLLSFPKKKPVAVQRLREMSCLILIRRWNQY